MQPAHGDLREASLRLLKDFNLIKKVIWMSAISRDESGNIVEKYEQLLNVSVLQLQCREILLLLEMKQGGLLPDFSEKRILLRFSRIATTRIVSKLCNTVWTANQ